MNMNMNPTLRRQLIRLGSENPNLRPAIRQIVTAASQPKMTKKVSRGQVPKETRSLVDKLYDVLHLWDKSYHYLTWDLGEFSDGSFGYQAKEFPVTVLLGANGFLVYLGTQTFREGSLPAVVKRLSGSKGVENAARALAIAEGDWLRYARYVDKGPHADTRKAAIKEKEGYFYARFIDKGPRDDTRKAAIREGNGYVYALEVDKGPRDDTREAAIREGYGNEYARDIDKGPRDDTREAAIREGNGYFYGRHIDKEPRDDTRRAAIKEGQGAAYAAWEATLK